jgi:general secretion pathway protein G
MKFTLGFRQGQRGASQSGLTLLELLLVSALAVVLGAIAVPAARDHVERGRRAKAIAQIHELQTKFLQIHEETDRYPEALTDVPWIELDPWGNRYQYLRIEGEPPSIRGRARKDRFLVPINSTYDLYSMGPDGESRGPLNAKQSHDDVIRANDGQFVGVAANY